MPAIESSLLETYLLVGAVVFGLGLVGFIARRNMIVMFLAAEMMLQGISLTLVGFSRFHNDWGGQILVVFIIAVAACEAALALALVLMLFRQAGSLDMAYWQKLREDHLRRFVDHELPEIPDVQQTWPTLTPAGRLPETDEEPRLHRTHV